MTGAEPRLTVTDTPDASAQRAIATGLRAFNEAAGGPHDSRQLAVIVSDPASGMVLGGLTGRTSMGVLFVDLFFLPAHLRGRGLGSRVLGLAEAEARRRGCLAAMLYTISFQAPGLYERHGYRLFGTIDCEPPGTQRLFFSKILE